MKLPAILFAIAAIVSTQACVAADEHVHGAAEQGKATNMAPTTMMGFMDHEQMTKMHEHMEQMQAMMQAIKKEKDPAKRKQLMQKHMDNMQDSMKMMGGAMMGTTSKGNMSTMSMDEKMNMMQNQMDMMGMMMQQMLEHHSQDTETHK